MKSIACALLLLTAAACEQPPPGQPPPASATAERYQTRGRITRLAPAAGGTVVDIHHEAMPAVKGYDGTTQPMDSMTMPFTAVPGLSLDGLAVGSPVAFTFEAHYDAPPTLRLTAITALPADTALELR